MPHGATGEPTVYANIHLPNQHPFMLAQFRERGVVLERYLTMTPELEAQVAHALRAQREYADGVKHRLTFGDVAFDIKKGDRGT